jgi:hypothetical protein
MGILMPVLIGMVALGTEITFAFAKHRQLQMFADAGAFSAAIAQRIGYPDRTLEANAIVKQLANDNINNYANDITVAVTSPSPEKIAVDVSQPQTLAMVNFVCSLPWPGSAGCPNIISGIFTVRARAVAVASAGGSYCVLALNKSSTSVKTQGTATVNLTGCSLAVSSTGNPSVQVSGGGTINADKVTTWGTVNTSGGGAINVPPDGGIFQNSTEPFSDPYSNIATPSVAGSCPSKFKNITISSGCTFSGNVALNSGDSLTLKANDPTVGSVYVINGNLTVNGGASLFGDNVTIVVTGEIKVNGGATVDVTAPPKGVTQGIAFFGKGSGSSSFEGGATQSIIGAVYLPKQTVKYAGGNTTSATKCMELVADNITFTGNSNFALDCTGIAIGDLGGTLVDLVE